MNTNNAEQRLVDAEAKLTRALQRLSALRRAALYGNYDPAEFDRAVMAYREAEMEAQEARKALAQRGHKPEPAAVQAARQTVAQASEPEEASFALEATPRLLFYRWLYQTGRLTDSL